MKKFSKGLEKWNNQDTLHAVYMTMKAIILLYLLSVSIDWLKDRHGTLFILFPTVGYLFAAYLIASGKESSDDE